MAEVFEIGGGRYVDGGAVRSGHGNAAAVCRCFASMGHYLREDAGVERGRHSFMFHALHGGCKDVAVGCGGVLELGVVAHAER